MDYSTKMCILLAIADVVVIAYKSYNYYFTKKKKQEETEEINDAIMFSLEEDSEINRRKSKHSGCMITQSMDKLLHYLSLPKYNLDLCMYLMTNRDLMNALLLLHSRGVKIRFIIDADMAYISRFVTKTLSKQGIPIRCWESKNNMHHKFVVVDALCEKGKATPFFITGSLNWTNQALCGNYEGCLVTSRKELVEQYQAEFDSLWVNAKPIKH